MTQLGKGSGLVRSTARRAMLAAALSFGSGLLHAETKPLRLVVAFAPGGPVDAVGRVISEQLGKELGRTVVIDNRPGANGSIGALEVARSAPDGTTLWLTSVGAVAVNPALYEKLPYDMKRDFAPVSLVVNNVEVLVVGETDPANDAASFVAGARKRDKSVAMASSGIGSIPHLAIEQLMDATGIRLLHVPYKGAAPAINDLMGGQVGGFFGDVPGLIGYVRSGKLKAIGVASSKRLESLPQVRTLDEQGIKGVDTINWYALFAPAKTPADIVEKLNKAVHNTLATPAVRDRLIQSGAEPASSTPKELGTLLAHDTDKWTRLIRAKNIKVD